MWNRLCFGVVLALSLANAADHGTFKDCSRVDYCTNFRKTPPAPDGFAYYIDINTIETSQGPGNAILKATIKHPDLTIDDLELTINGIESNTFRVQISEIDSKRYQLVDVLNGEPKLGDFRYSSDDDYYQASDLDGNSVRMYLNPFRLEFSQQGGPAKVVLEGTYLAVLQTAPFRASFKFPLASHFYGVHEHADRLSLRPTKNQDPYRLKNSDVANYELNSPMALYGAVPLIYAHGANDTSGVFLHNAAEQWIEVGDAGDARATFYAETGAIDFFVLLGPTPNATVRQYTALTGTAHLPQLWALGYQQSRYSYDSQDDVKAVLDGFVDNDLQLDAIWLDIDYTDGFRYFTWNPATFSDPIGLQEYVGSRKRKMVVISDPHIKAEQGYWVYDQGMERDVFVKNADGSVFQGPCWPGTSAYIDFLNPAARDWYGGLYSYENFNATSPIIAGIWNDMNEPSVFDNGLEMTLPADSSHLNGVTHREIHNIYGFLQTKATHAGLMQRDNGRLRPFILTRSHFAGSQRYALFWTGDNTADWGYVAVSYSECLNANILGLVFCGADMGGYFGNPDAELQTRWFQAGAWLPFFRAHAAKDTARREPYLLPEPWKSIVRTTLETRYKHISHWYTLFYEHVRNGDPVIRPLFYQYPNDENVFEIDDQLLAGSDILVKAITAPGVDSVQVYFPGGEDQMWYAMDRSDEVRAGTGWVDVPVTQEYIPVYYRGGSIVTRKDTKTSSTVDLIHEGYYIHVNLDKNNYSYGNIYLDDNESFDYVNGEHFYYYYVAATGEENTDITVGVIDGNGPIEDKAFKFTINQIIINKVLVEPKGNEAGKFSQKIYHTDASGKLLKDMEIKEKISFKLV